MPKSPVQLPIWLRPEPAGRRPGLTREKIAAAALAIADAKGFDAVSMRRIAVKLGAGTMSLYHYVRSRDDLVALMDDALMAEILIPDDKLPADWRKAVTAIARRTRAVFVKHPWALVSMRGALPGPNGMRHFEQGLAALANAPMDRDGKLELLALVDDLVFGNTLRADETQMSGSRDPRVVEAFFGFAKRLLDTGKFPHTAAMFVEVDPAKAREAAGLGGDLLRFERGLSALLDDAQLRMKGARRK